jgi:hypothetical protein
VDISLQDQRRNYLERIAYLAYFFFETMEEDAGDGHSGIINLINPLPDKLSMQQLRELILRDLLASRQAQGLAISITDAALKAAKKLQSADIAPFEDDDDDVLLLKSICARYEHPFENVQSEEKRRARGCMRLVRLLWLMHIHGVGAHSRALEFIFPNDKILIGRSPKAPATGYHPEHVVPCAFIRDEIFRRFETERRLVPQGRAKEDLVCMQGMVQLIERLMAVAYIHPDERDALDSGKGALKDKMPEGWDPDTGDILNRLRVRANIEFLLPM